MPQVVVKKPTGLILAYMDLNGFAGLATPWRTIYIKDGHETPALLRHEYTHIDQMDRDGTIWFCIRYAYQLIRYGYWNAPYEIEARQAE